MTPEASKLSQIIEVADIAWESLTATIRVKRLWSDDATNRRAQLIRYEPGASLPMHRHVGDQLLYVIEGTISDEAGTVGAGSVSYRPDGCIHSETSKNGATALAVMSGRVQPATEMGAAPVSQTIVLSEMAWTEAMPGVLWKPFWSDPTTHRRAIFARFAPGAKLPRHKHMGDELLFMIEGSNFDETGELRTGNLAYFPNGCTHTVVSKNGHTAMAFVTGESETVK
jgi:anti-sigma factor ChrR (cupin superfamily)